MEIWFTTAKNGKASAWFFNMSARRSFRLPMQYAEFLIATGEAVQIAKPFHRN